MNLLVFAIVTVLVVVIVRVDEMTELFVGVGVSVRVLVHVCCLCFGECCEARISPRQDSIRRASIAAVQ